MSPQIPTTKLNSGYEIPLVGFGTWQSEPGQVGAAVREAIKAGYTHLDFAKIYENQKEIAPSLKDVPREKLFITSKLWNTAHKPELVEPALDDTLKELGLDYLDLYLVHWPVAFDNGTNVTGDLFPTGSDGKPALDLKTTLVDTWKAMVALLKTGKVKSVGVSNFNPESIDAIIAATGVVPAVNQIERHPHLLNTENVEYAKSKGIHITAYSPLGNNSEGVPLLTSHDVVKKVADKHNVTTGQVLVAWAISDPDGAISVIPKSVHPERIRQNLLPVKLDKEDIDAITDIGVKDPRRFNIAPDWDINVFDTEKEKAQTAHSVNIK